MRRIWHAILSLTRQQVRSIYAIAMLAGIVAYCAMGALVLFFAYDAALENRDWFRMAWEVLRYIFFLIAMNAAIVALTVFGADYFKAKYGDKEVEFGGRKDQ